MIATSLDEIVARCDFLELTDSATLYPNHSGSGLALLRVNTPKCRATLALNGAQLMSFTPNDGAELLWVSPQCNFSPNASLRGGIPLCLPWFGPHPSDHSRPKHGIARTQTWELSTAYLDEQGSAVLQLCLNHTADALFEYDFSAQLSLTLGDTLALELALTNQSSRAFNASWVMHTYFAVSDITQVRIEGLDGCEYSDKVKAGERFIQSGPIRFTGELDRVYENIQQPVTLNDASRRLQVTGDKSPSVVVWNTGPELAANIGDIGAGNHVGYVCVERGACLNDSWTMAPGETRLGQMSIDFD
ncbi:D-hexose-6-phosphate mutarotase [Gilvimarinus polysaccharolyticus]|uniref:D-hexose-6-phosphate mutarotase n=1 Tax=Gilvimarinus polysaccharolyticus TaxID=863921 RepID=UPI0006737178|nr:D-hexose-6-phosphate mutarotase [Gilvimarinus polysaccharolyticus]